METSTTLRKKTLTDPVNNADTLQLEVDVQGLMKRIQDGVIIGREQIKNGQCMTLAESQALINKELFN